jgi:preprotein translocase subunit SecD
MRVAVPRAWVRARRTILSADTVSFLAAAVLYYFAAGDVKGFAFALGLSTILDLVVVFLFTHPIVSLLSRSAAFGSARFTGLNAVRAGGVVPDSVATEPPPAPARRARPAKVAASGKRSQAPVVLLDEDEDDDGEAAAVPESSDPQVAQTADVPASAADAPDEPDRARAAPEPGTAAERAAARRARMRAGNGDEKGKR